MESKSGLFELWRRFGSVTGFFKPAPSPKPRQKPKILAPNWLPYFFNRSKGSTPESVWKRFDDASSIKINTPFSFPARGEYARIFGGEIFYANWLPKPATKWMPGYCCF